MLELSASRLTPDTRTQALVMKPEQDDHAEDDRGEQDLPNVVVEDLLIRVRGVAEVNLLLR